MRQLWMSLVLILLIAVGGWALMNRSKIETVDDAIELAQQQIGELADQSLGEFNAESSDALFGDDPQIRIAALRFDAAHHLLQNPQAAPTALENLRQFDVIALQDLPVSTDAMRSLLKMLNLNGRQYELIHGPRMTNGKSNRQLGFLFDLRKISLDSSNPYVVNDPDQLFETAPFVAWFRVNADADKAFTFTLVNLALSPQNAETESQHLGELFRAVRDDGRNEDDVILLGDFQNAMNSVKQWQTLTGLESIVPPDQHAAAVKQTGIGGLYDARATTEFNRRCGLVDLLQGQDAQSIHRAPPCPLIWAEFSIHESRRDGTFANQFGPNETK